MIITGSWAFSCAAYAGVDRHKDKKNANDRLLICEYIIHVHVFIYIYTGAIYSNTTHTALTHVKRLATISTGLEHNNSV